MDENTTWYGSRPRPRRHCIRRVPALHEMGTAAPLFLVHVYCGHGRPSQLVLSSCNITNHEVVNYGYNGQTELSSWQ